MGNLSYCFKYFNYLKLSLRKFFFVFLICSGISACGQFEKLEGDFINVVKGDLIEFGYYQISNSIIRSAGYEGGGVIDIWYIPLFRNSSQDLFYEIQIENYPDSYVYEYPYPKPSGIYLKKKNEWVIEKIYDDDYIYTASKNDGEIIVHFKLPSNKRKDYIFTVVKFETGEDLVLVIDAKEEYLGSGFFGFVVVS